MTSLKVYVLALRYLMALVDSRSLIDDNSKIDEEIQKNFASIIANMELEDKL